MFPDRCSALCLPLLALWRHGFAIIGLCFLTGVLRSAFHFWHCSAVGSQFPEYVSSTCATTNRTGAHVLVPCQENSGGTIYVESARAVARKATVAEDIYNFAKNHNVNIVPADIPKLFKHDCTPVEAFMRRIMCAVYEFDRDTIVHRLAD